MSGDHKISSDTLHAFIDGELSIEQSAAVENAVKTDAALEQRIADYRADKARLAEIYNQIIEEPLPAKWIDLIEGDQRKRRPIFSTQAIAAMAATAFLVVVGGALLYRQSVPHEEPIIEEALAARNDAMPAHQNFAVTASTRDATTNHLMASALAMHVRAPDLTRMGYKLTGVRLYEGVPGGKAVELLYRQRDNRLVALYVRHSSGMVRFDQFRQSGLRICIWQDDVLGTVVTGEMSAAEMQRLASLAYTGLES